MAHGARNMAVDAAMLECAASGVTLFRLYGWEPWCLSLGRNQRVPARLLGRRRADLRPGLDVVRRQTGGRSVFHGPEITYAVACRDRALGGPRPALHLVHRALARALRSLGVPLDPPAASGAPAGDSFSVLDDTGAPPNTGASAVHAPAGTTPRTAPGAPAGTHALDGTRAWADISGSLSPADGTAGSGQLSGAACFRDPAPSELTVAGRKLVGSAQCRRRGALLQHGSILIDDRQQLGDLRPGSNRADGGGHRVPREGRDSQAERRTARATPSPAIGMSEALGRVPDHDALVSALTEALAAALGPPASSEQARATVAAVVGRVSEHEARHASPDWLWAARSGRF